MADFQNEIYISKKLSKFIEEDPRNVLSAHNNMKIYDAPLIGFASTDDPYFAEFRTSEIVGPEFMLPENWLPNARSIISYFLPFSEEIRNSNRALGLPSQEWLSARIDGESFNNAVRVFLMDLIKSMNADAIAPGIDLRFKVEERISNWSERHVAFVAGLGTFGLHRALITSKGTAGRIGSVITSLSLTPTQRNYTQYFEYCLYLTQGKCGACMKRCPPAAITAEGKDNKACSDYIDEIMSKFAPRYGCAKCNISVPCENKIPVITL